LEYKPFKWPNKILRRRTRELAVVNSIPSNTGRSVEGAEEITETRIISSGRKPEVPGKPTLANDIRIRKNENTGMALKRPEKARMERV